MEPCSSSSSNGKTVERAAAPMTRSDILRQYRISKPTESTLWCPNTWTPEMVEFYTKIDKSKRTFDCRKVLNKIRDKHGSTPMDWTVDPMDKKGPSASRLKCHKCKQYGHMACDCREPYKPIVCIMCGLEGHDLHTCPRKLCLSCGSQQSKYRNYCPTCASMENSICRTCNAVGHGPIYCTESWRQFHNITSSDPELESTEFAKSTSRSIAKETCQSTLGISENLSAISISIDKQINKISPKTVDSCKSKKIRIE